MSIVRACDLSAEDRRVLGNNLRPPARRRRPRRVLAAVNRSIQRLAEGVPQLHRLRC